MVATKMLQYIIYRIPKPPKFRLEEESALEHSAMLYSYSKTAFTLSTDTVCRHALIRRSIRDEHVLYVVGFTFFALYAYIAFDINDSRYIDIITIDVVLVLLYLFFITAGLFLFRFSAY